MSALAFVWRGDGVLGVPGARGKPCSARSSTASGGVASCGAATACWPCQVAALRAQSQRGAVLTPARRSRPAQRGLARRWPYASPTAPPAKPLRIARYSDSRAPVTHRLRLGLYHALSYGQSLVDRLAFFAKFSGATRRKANKGIAAVCRPGRGSLTLWFRMRGSKSVAPSSSSSPRPPPKSSLRSITREQLASERVPDVSHRSIRGEISICFGSQAAPS